MFYCFISILIGRLGGVRFIGHFVALVLILFPRGNEQNKENLNQEESSPIANNS